MSGLNNIPLITPSADPEITFGCDPEVFIFNGNGKVLAADKFLTDQHNAEKTVRGCIFFDGIAAELNPRSSYCRYYLMDNLWFCLKDLDDKLREKASFQNRTTVKVDPDVLEKADERAKMFGCDPSRHAHNDVGRVDPRKIDGTKHFGRYCGGHIHIGFRRHEKEEIQENADTFIKLMDIFVGNTMVLIDRNPENQKRRKLYGRAGEYRIPSHGIEYRVLSNFWLHAPEIMSLVFGIARYTAAVYFEENLRKAVLDAVDIEVVKKAINNNDKFLAWKTYKIIRPLFDITDGTDLLPLNSEGLIYFEWLIMRGMKRVFPRSIQNNWRLDVSKFNYVGHAGTNLGFQLGMQKKMKSSLDNNWFYFQDMESRRDPDVIEKLIFREGRSCCGSQTRWRKRTRPDDGRRRGCRCGSLEEQAVGQTGKKYGSLLRREIPA